MYEMYGRLIATLIKYYPNKSLPIEEGYHMFIYLSVLKYLAKGCRNCWVLFKQTCLVYSNSTKMLHMNGFGVIIGKILLKSIISLKKMNFEACLWLIYNLNQEMQPE